ncbi:uncharacterized protein BO96DRAFT_334878, partial [Aspergillus niger CBS 101883]
VISSLYIHGRCTRSGYIGPLLESRTTKASPLLCWKVQATANVFPSTLLFKSDEGFTVTSNGEDCLALLIGSLGDGPQNSNRLVKSACDTDFLGKGNSFQGCREHDFVICSYARIPWPGECRRM